MTDRRVVDVHGVLVFLGEGDSRSADEAASTARVADSRAHIVDGVEEDGDFLVLVLDDNVDVEQLLLYNHLYKGHGG